MVEDNEKVESVETPEAEQPAAPAQEAAPVQETPAAAAPQPSPGAAPAAAADKDANMWAMLCHLSALSAVFTGIGFILGPLVVWLIKKNQYPVVDDQGKESLNFQISVVIYMIAAWVVTIATFGILFILPIAVGVFDLIMVIIASVRANEGQLYRYPLTMRFLK